MSSQGNAGPPQVSLHPLGGAGASQGWGRSQSDTIHALVNTQARAWPDAVYAGSTEQPDGAPQSFGTLKQRCEQISALLAAHGVAPGETVSFVMPNGIATLLLLLGAMYGGRCVNPINLLSQPEQMRYVIEHSECRLVCVAPAWEETVRAMLAQVPRPIALLVVEPDSATLSPLVLPTAAAVTEPGPDTIGLLMYTSGTTGRPKGVLLSQANLAANAHAISAEHRLGPADRVLAVMPLYHINAFTVTMLAPLAHGGGVWMTPKFSASVFWQQVADAGCTWINVVPTIVSYLLEGAQPPVEQTGAIRFCRSASAALPPEHLRAFEHKFGIGVIETMGLTETAAPAFSNPLDPARRKIGAVGLASGCEARIVDTRLQPVADGVTGELVIRGPSVMRGYFKDAGATAQAFTPDGWLRTGDLGHRDVDGFFFVTGRSKELIIKGGENIAPREIDEALLAHPAVLEAAAVGVPDRHYGQDIMVCVVLRPGVPCTEDELRAFCLERLGRYKSPRWLRFVTALPRGPSGKVQRLKLLDAENPLDPAKA